jgi:hypothetical protein
VKEERVNTQLTSERNYLLRAVDRDREELRDAMQGLKRVAQERVEALRVGQYVSARPVPYLIGGFLLGLWLGWGRAEDE